jgi:hypothetical protein
VRRRFFPTSDYFAHLNGRSVPPRGRPHRVADRPSVSSSGGPRCRWALCGQEQPPRSPEAGTAARRTAVARGIVDAEGEIFLFASHRDTGKQERPPIPSAITRVVQGYENRPLELFDRGPTPNADIAKKRPGPQEPGHRPTEGRRSTPRSLPPTFGHLAPLLPPFAHAKAESRSRSSPVGARSHQPG